MEDNIEKLLNKRFLLQEEYLGVDKVVNRVVPLVSVTVTTYQHANYIKECLDGILMQKVDFPFEIIIGDDDSSDGTQEVCKEYAEKYPDKIRLFIRDRKLSHYTTKDGKSIRFNGVWNRMAARGKYIALCEGDDYWIDPYKLQKQVDFMEAHPDYTMCFHNALEVWQNDANKNKLFSILENKEYSALEIYPNWIVPTASVVFRKSVVDSTLYKGCSVNTNFIFGDIIIFLSCCRHGKIFGFSDIMSVYRKHSGGVVYNMCLERDYKQCIHDVELAFEFEDLGLKNSAYKSCSCRAIRGVLYSLRYKRKRYLFIKFVHVFLKVSSVKYLGSYIRGFLSFIKHPNLYNSDYDK